MKTIHKNIFFLVNKIYDCLAVYGYLLKLNSLRNEHKTKKLYRRNKGGMAEVLSI